VLEEGELVSCRLSAPSNAADFSGILDELDGALSGGGIDNIGLDEGSAAEDWRHATGKEDSTETELFSAGTKSFRCSLRAGAEVLTKATNSFTEMVDKLDWFCNGGMIKVDNSREDTNSPRFTFRSLVNNAQ